MIKAIIFDFDGLLVNTEELRELSIRNFLKRYGKVFKRSDYVMTMSGSREEVTKFLKKKYSLPGQIDKLSDERISIFDQLFGERLALMEGVTQLLTRARKLKVKCAIATGRGKDYVLDGLNRLGILDNFEAIVCAEDVVKRKPDPEVYLLAAKKIGIAPSFCLALDDSPNGVESAKNAGMKVIYVPSARYFDSWHDDADLTVKSLHEVSDGILNKLAK